MQSEQKATRRVLQTKGLKLNRTRPWHQRHTEGHQNPDKLFFLAAFMLNYAC